MQPAIVLRSKPAAAGNVLYLLLPVPIKSDLRANRTPVAPGSLQSKFDPLVLRVHGVLVDQQWSALVGDHYIADAAIPQIGHRHGTAVVDVRCAHGLGYVYKFCGSIVDPDFLLLVAGQATSVEGGPIGCVSDNFAVATGDPR